MDFERAFDLLGLAPGASEPEIEAAYRRLCQELDARIGRVRSLALRDRYATTRAELEGARAVTLQAAKFGAPRIARQGNASRPWAVLGVEVGASPLDVASAYVSLCEELDRELAAATSEVLRHRCLEARAEVDSAYQHCAAAPLAAEVATGDESARYETQVARATFEAPPAPERPAPDPALLRILADPDPPALRARRSPRRRPLRRLAIAAALVLFALGASLGYAWWRDPEQVRFIARYFPLPLHPELVEAQTEAEYLRRRVDEERRDIQRRAKEASARSALAKHLFELTERHVFSSGALAEAYGHMELASELASAGEAKRAVAAYAEASANLEATLRRLDEAESALGARYEAVDARDAWVALAASVALEPGAQVLEGGQRLVAADGLLEAGNFAAAIPELRQASQGFRSALDVGQHELAARRAGDAADQSGTGDALPPVSANDRGDVKLVTIPAGAELAAFSIDRTEVRVSEYRRCVDEGACAPPDAASGCNWSAPGRSDHPINCIDWEQANAYCGWIGKRLPTEQEWEKAARGTDGLFDTAGNVDEWTGSSFESGGGARVLRGGSRKNDADTIRSFHRRGALPDLRDASVGFRCAEGALVTGMTD